MCLAHFTTCFLEVRGYLIKHGGVFIQVSKVSLDVVVLLFDGPLNHGVLDLIFGVLVNLDALVTHEHILGVAVEVSLEEHRGLGVGHNDVMTLQSLLSLAFVELFLILFFRFLCQFLLRSTLSFLS